MHAIRRIAEGMRKTLVAAASDERIDRRWWALLREQWVIGVAPAEVPA
jgi:hypothetical protein